MRLTEDEHERVVQGVQQAYAEGHLTREEMDERLDLALKATTREELAPALAGLPDHLVPRDETVEIRASAGRIKRTGAWRVPRTLKIDSDYGKVTLDLSQAVIEHSEIEIRLRLETGSAKIVLPPGATVDFDGLTTEWRPPRYRTPSRGGKGPRLHIRLTGTMTYGRLKIRHRRRGAS